VPRPALPPAPAPVRRRATDRPARTAPAPLDRWPAGGGGAPGPAVPAPRVRAITLLGLQGMGRPRAAAPGAEADAAGPGGPRHRPAGPRSRRSSGRAGLPRPEPAMMPRQQSGQLVPMAVPEGEDVRAVRPGAVPAGPPRWRRSGRGAPGGGPGGPPPASRVVVAVAVATRARSVAPGPGPSGSQVEEAEASRVSTRCRRPRSEAYASGRVTGRRSGWPGGLADRPGREDRCRRHVAGAGAVPPGRDGDGDPVGLRRHAAGARHGAQLRHRGRLARGRGPRAAGELRHRVR
jgi:translation initiation factor IF-2